MKKSDEMFRDVRYEPDHLTEEDLERGVLRKYSSSLLGAEITLEVDESVAADIIWIRTRETGTEKPVSIFGDGEILAIAQAIEELKEELGYA